MVGKEDTNKKPAQKSIASFFAPKAAAGGGGGGSSQSSSQTGASSSSQSLSKDEKKKDDEEKVTAPVEEKKNEDKPAKFSRLRPMDDEDNDEEMADVKKPAQEEEEKKSEEKTKSPAAAANSFFAPKKTTKKEEEETSSVLGKRQSVEEKEEKKEEEKVAEVKKAKKVAVKEQDNDDDDDEDFSLSQEESEEEEKSSSKKKKGKKQQQTIDMMVVDEKKKKPSAAAAATTPSEEEKKPASAKKSAVADEIDDEEDDASQHDDDSDADVPDPRRKSATPAKKGAKSGAGGGGGAASKAKLQIAGDLKNFDPLAGITWKKGEKIPYLFLARSFEKIEQESSRLTTTSLLIQTLRTIIATNESDLLPAIYLCVNLVTPPHEGVELGVGESLLVKSLAEATGKSVQQIKSDLSEEGDIGIIAKNARTTQRTLFKSKSLTISQVFAEFKAIATENGKDAQKRRGDRIKNLLVAAQESEAVYIMRALGGRLRIGCNESTVISALAQAMVYTPPARVDLAGMKPNEETLDRAVAILKNVHAELPSWDLIVAKLLTVSIFDLQNHLFLTPGIPVKPMLAHPTKAIGEVLDRLGDNPFVCEYKYDGERAQIHVLENGQIKIFSRNSEDNTQKFPDVMEFLPRAIKSGVQSCIIDAEVVAFDEAKGGILPFQVLSTRSRKLVKLEDVKVHVCLFVFDMLYLNGKSLLREGLQERREKLRETIQEMDCKVRFAQSKTCTEPDDIMSFLNEAVAGNCEGLMVKALDGGSASYEPDKRSHKWLKVKKDYLQGLGDSLDLVPIAAYFGRGKRTGTYGAFLLATYNQEDECYQTVTKIGTGFKDEDLQNFTTSLKATAIATPPFYYSWTDVPQLRPDVWFEPSQVWEVAAADLSLSPVHTAARGLVDSVRGIALRFPRLLRVREDKKPEESTSPEQIAEMYQKQAINSNHAKKNGGDSDDD